MKDSLLLATERSILRTPLTTQTAVVCNCALLASNPASRYLAKVYSQEFDSSLIETFLFSRS